MSNSRSVAKRHRQSLDRRARNRVFQSHVRKSFKRLESAMAERNDEVLETCFRDFVRTVDRAMVKGLYHRNTAARKKSRIAGKLAGYRAG